MCHLLKGGGTGLEQVRDPSSKSRRWFESGICMQKGADERTTDLVEDAMGEWVLVAVVQGPCCHCKIQLYEMAYFSG
jgi:hypothetical protein